jgi:hypothetical protein
VDKAKLVSSGRDVRGYHVARERAFRGDVAAIRSQILSVRQPDPKVIEKLLAVCSEARAKAVRDVLREIGWGV